MRPFFVALVLCLTTPALAQGGVLVDGVPVAGALTAEADTLSTGEHFVRYTVERTDAAPFEVHLVSYAFDPYLVVVPPSGTRLSNDDWGGSAYDARLVVEAGQPGVWEVFVTSFARAETGEFELAHRVLTATEVARLEEVEAALTRATSLNGQVVARYREGRHAEAAALAREVVSLREAALGPDHPALATSLNILASLLKAQGDFGAARPLYERALAIYESALGPDHPDVATGLNNLAGLLKTQGDYDAARAPYERALAIREAALGAHHPDVAASLNNLASLLKAQGDYDAARPLLERAIGIWEAELGPDHPNVATSLNNLAGLLQTQGDFAAARALYERSLAIRETAFGAEHPSVALVLNNLASLLEAQGDYAAAKPLHERALAIRESALGPDHPDVAQSLNNLAAIHKAQGDYAAARPLYERALSIWEAALGEGHPDVARSLNNLATLLQLQGDYAAARPRLERALSIYEGALGPEHPDVAQNLSNLASLLRAQGEVASARPLYERALAIRETALGPDHPLVALTLNNLASLLEEQGDYAAARPLYERALAVREATLGEAHPDVAGSLNNLALFLRRQGEVAAARPLYERALAVWEAALGPDHPNVAASLNNLASLLDAQGDDAAAQPLYERAAHIYDGLAEQVLPTLSAAEQRALTELDLGAQTGALLSSHREGEALATAYGLLGGWKGLLLREMRRQTASARLADDPAHAEAAARLQNLRTQVAQAYRTGDPALTALTEEKERLERSLAAFLPGDALEDPWRTHGPDGIRTLLPTDAAFADLYRHGYWESGQFVETRYSAVVTASGAAPFLTDLGAAAPLEEALAAWRDEVVAGRDADTAALAAALWGPLADALPEGTARVWLSPDGDLGRAPWAALAGAHGTTADLLVAQVPSARALLALLTDEPETESSPSLLLVGGVDFGDGAGFAVLPGTDAEVEALATLAAAEGLAPTILTDDAPTAPVVADALGGATYAHLATHGFFYGEDEAAYEARGGAGGARTDVLGGPGGAPVGVNRNPLAESGLALAGANDGDGGGTLTAEELVGLDLADTRLVVLSACETGRGTEVTGQGVLGLQASFTAAGSRSLLMSLWSVPDASTAALMAAFYRGLWEEGLSPAEALRAAQAEVRSAPGWEAPVHWAAWVLSGDAFASGG